MIYESEKSMILLPRLMHAVRLLESMVHAKSIWTTLPLQTRISQKLGLDDTYNFFPFE